jgi:hypothetical protein
VGCFGQSLLHELTALLAASCLVQVLNLSLAASETHKWYKSKFEDYPPLRRAMFPFIY